MQWNRAISLGFAILATSVGCGRSAAPGAAATAKPTATTAKQTAATEQSTLATTSAPPAATPVVNDDTPAPASSEIPESSAKAPAPAQQSEADKPADASEAKEGGARERIAVLTLGGPLVVDAWLTTDGRSHIEVFQEQVNEVLAAADVDKDGRSTWKELASNKTYLEGKLPNGSLAGDRLAEMWAERYDLNRDRRIAAVEAAAWMGIDAGRSARAFEVRSTRSYFPNPRATSRIWQLVDADRDGQLSAEEVQGASAKIWRLDADDDRMISPPELATLRQLLEAAGGQMTQPSREAARDAAIHLEPRSDIDRLEYVLIDLYSPRRQLGPGSFPELAGLFQTLDANDDESLHHDELAELLDIEPQVEVAVDFGKPGATGEIEAQLKLRESAPEIALHAQPSSDRVIVSLGNTRVVISAHDFAPPPNANRYGPPRALRLMVHDQCDALGEELDANGDGLLGEREIDLMPDRLLKRDADGDGRIAPHELPYWLIVAFLRGEQPQEQSFYQPAFASRGGGDTASPSWFQHADFNGDGDISRREFLGSLEQFATLDADQNGYISADEAAEE